MYVAVRLKFLNPSSRPELVPRPFRELRVGIEGKRGGVELLRNNPRTNWRSAGAPGWTSFNISKFIGTNLPLRIVEITFLSTNSDSYSKNLVRFIFIIVSLLER
jgi:hypothetical protein